MLVWCNGLSITALQAAGTGSIPVTSSLLRDVAQLVGCMLREHEVVSSSLTIPTEMIERKEKHYEDANT